MNNDAQVELAHNSNKKILWLHKLLYNLDGRKQKLVGRKLKWAAFAIFALPFVFLLLQNAEPTREKTSVDTAQPVIDNKPFEIPGVATGKTSSNAFEKKSKSAFRFSGPQLIVRPFMDSIPPGSMVKAKLVSGGSNGPVRVELLEPLTIGGQTLADIGSVLSGKGNSTEDRLLIHFKKLISKDGAVQSISADACDGDDKIAGIRGSKVGGAALRLAGSIGLEFVGGMAEGLQQTNSQFGMEVKQPSLKNAALSGTAQSALDQSHELMNSLKEQRPVIEVKAGTVIFVLFDSLPKGELND